jgi:hypothetical protein
MCTICISLCLKSLQIHVDFYQRIFETINVWVDKEIVGGYQYIVENFTVWVDK